MVRSFIAHSLAVVAVALAVPAAARAQMPNAYGTPITLDQAKRVVAPAIEAARKNNWTMCVAIVDPAGNLVYFEKMDNTQNGSSIVAVNKARSAAQFKRPTKEFQDGLAAGGVGLRLLQIEGVVAVEGGIPLLQDGKIVGAIGVSGAASSQDAQVAQAGADLMK